MNKKSTGNGFLILSVASILGKLLSAIYVPLLTAVLGGTGYGIYTAGYDIFVFLIAVTSLGIQPAVTKVVTEYRTLGNYKDSLKAMKLARKYFTLIAIAVSGIYLVVVVPLAKIINRENSTLTFIFLAPALIFAAIIAAYRGYMQGMEDMQPLAISQLIEQLVNVLISLVFAAILLAITKDLRWGSAGGTVGTSLGAVAAIIYIIYIFEKRNYREETEKNHDPSVKRIHNKKIVRKLFSYAIPICIVAGVQNFAGVIDTITLGVLLKKAGLGAEVDNLSAVLSYYKTMIYVPLAIVTALGTSIFPKIIEAFIRRDRKDLRRQTSYSFRLSYIIVIPATFGLAILSKEIYAFMFNGSPGHELVTYGSTLLILMSITTIQNVILQGINKLYVIIASVSAGLLVKIILNIILIPIPFLNVAGAVIATFVSYLIPAIINHRKIEGSFRVKVPIIRQGIVPLICSILMTIVIYICKFPIVKLAENLGGGRIVMIIATLILISIGGAIYLTLMIYLGGIRRRDLDLISPRIIRFLPRRLRKQLI